MAESVATIGLQQEQYFELLPPKDDKRVGEEVFKLLSEVVKYKQDQGLPEKWSRFYSLDKNRHWKTAPGTAQNVSLVSANLLWAHRQKTLALLTNNNPTFNISRKGSPDVPQEKLDALLKTCENWWIDTEQQFELESSVKNGETFGVTIEKSIFNPDAEFALGEAETEVIDPFYFGVYPTDCLKLQKAEAVFHFRPMSVREAKRRYPDFADKIEPDSEILKKLGDARKEIGRTAEKQAENTTVSGVVKSLVNIFGTAREDAEETLIVECWCKDYSLIQDEQGNDIPKYAGFIRCVTVCSGGQTVLSDRSNPSINPALPPELAIRTYLYDKYPFSLTPSVTDTASIWGQSDFEQLEGLQIEFNKIMSSISTWSKKASRLKIINPQTSGVNNASLTNAPGILNPTNVNHGIQYMQPPPVPSDLLAFKDVFKEIFFLIAGSFELENAQTPGREVIAYRAIGLLIEQVATQQRSKIRNYGKMIRERGRMYVSQVQNWYTEDRWIVYEDNTGQEQGMIINGRELIIPAKISIVSGSTLPRPQVQEREEAILLHKQGVIDNEELLKKLDWPAWRTVLKRMQAGPIGALFDRFSKAGVPPQLLQYLQELSKLDDKEIEGGKIPPFQAILAQLVPSLQQTPIPIGEQLEQAKLQAEIAKIQAETELTRQKARTEEIEQGRKAKGVQFDEEKLKIDRARTVHEIRTGKNTREYEATHGNEQGPYDERGMVSNNADL